MMTPTAADVTPWLPLLRRLSQRSPRWAPRKNADFALGGEGDKHHRHIHDDRKRSLRDVALEHEVWGV